MKRILTTHHWIIILATLALAGIGGIQASWIYEGHRLKQEEINLRLKDLTPEIAKQLKNQGYYSEKDFNGSEEPIVIDSLDWMMDKLMEEAGFVDNYFYAIYQKKEDGIFESNTKTQIEKLKKSPYQTCLTCIVTFHFLEKETDLDSLTSENIEGRTTSIRPDMTTIRSVKETLQGSEKTAEDILWLSINVPNQFMMAMRGIFSQLILTIFLMGLLIGLFVFTLRALAKQKKISQVKDDFFNNMTHEFKTPLSSIRLASVVLKKNVDEQKKNIYLNLIENESKKLESQVDKILQLSLLESQQMVLEKTKIDLHQIIQEVHQRLKLIIEQKDAIVTLQLELTEHFLQGDDTHLSNCIYNLLENALKYSGQSPQITIATFPKKNKKIISVEDNGKGIPKEHQAEIFDRFYRAQKNDQYQGRGFGIGLSYVKTIVEAHGGKIFLNTEYKSGCEFLMEFD